MILLQKDGDIISKKWYEGRKTDLSVESECIVEMAAKSQTKQEDIKNYEHGTSAYHTAHDVFLKNDCIPSLFQDVFAKELIKSPLKQISLKLSFSTNLSYIKLIQFGLAVAVDNCLASK